MSFTEFQARFEKPESRLIVQTCVGRSGSLFLQSLFDSHPSILMFPGILNYYCAIAPRMEAYQQEWLGVVEHSLTLWLSSSKPYNIFESLGKNRDQTLNVQVPSLVERVSHLISESIFSRKNVLLAIHYAIAEQLEIDLASVDSIYIHEHTNRLNDPWRKTICDDFPEAKFICILKDPRSNYLSIQKWHAKVRELPGDLWQEEFLQRRGFERRCWTWYRDFLVFFERHPDHQAIVRLEDIQADSQQYLATLCSFLDVDRHDALQSTTFGGLLWHGDSFSAPQAGVRSSASRSGWEERLSWVRKSVLNVSLKKEIEALGYFEGKLPNVAEYCTAFLLFPFWNIDDLSHMFSKKFFADSQKVRGQSKLKVATDNVWHYLKGLRKLLLGVLGARKYEKVPELVLRGE